MTINLALLLARFPKTSYSDLVLNIVFTAGALTAVYLLLCLPGLVKSRARHIILGGALFLFVLTSIDCRGLFPWMPELPFHYNWTGKFVELLVCLVALAVLIRLCGWNRQEFGLSLSFNPGTGKDLVRLVLPILLLELVALWLIIPRQMPTFEDHLFQLTAPGLTEELAFRGVLFALLDRAFSKRVRILGADLGWSTVVTSILFGLWHGLDVDAHFHFSLNMAPATIPLLGSFVLAWSRSRSGTLLVPFVLHAGMNEIAVLIGMAKALQ
jgi:uncharacterized protein